MRVLVFGDSITQGFWDVDGGWVARLRKQYDQKAIDTDDYSQPAIINLGVSGDSTNDLLARFDNEAKVRANDELAFVFAIGVNDSRTKDRVNYSDTGQYKANLHALVDLAKKYSSKMLFVGLTPCVQERTNPVVWGNTCYTNARICEFDAALRQFCIENSVPYVAVYERFAKAQETAELMPDGVHPNDQGHDLIARLIAPEIEKLL